jgi:gluconolactonase
LTDHLVDSDAQIEWLADGFGGSLPSGALKGVAEGPLWDDDGFLLFSDTANSKRYRWSEDDGLSLYREATNDANGLAHDLQGRVIACEHASRQVTRKELDGSITIVADNYRGFRLNRPNDVIVRSDGSIYFTDPISLGVDTELDLAGVYRVSSDLSRIHLIVRDFVFPNGLTFSTDESVLYINDSRRRHIRAFDVESRYNTGLLMLETDRILFQMTSEVEGVPDGMKLDCEGNVWCTGPGGIWVISPLGVHLGTVSAEPGRRFTNFCFGGADRRTLFVTTPTAVGRIPVRVAGLRIPHSSGD